jgi:hypothetical protein
MYNTRTYATISINDLSLIDFNQIIESDNYPLRNNIAQTQFVIKWNTEPTFIADGSVVPVGTYNHTEILQIMATPEWSKEIPVE